MAEEEIWMCSLHISSYPNNLWLTQGYLLLATAVAGLGCISVMTLFPGFCRKIPQAK